MEPFEIDKILKEKLEAGSEIHTHELEAAKPFVWSAVQSEINKKKPLTWVHLAAAVILLLMCFSFVLYTFKSAYTNQIDALTTKIDELDRAYQEQLVQVQTKDAQVESLDSELRQMEIQLAGLQPVEPPAAKEVFIHRTDTIYVKQVEYITRIEPEAVKEEALIDEEKMPEEVIATTNQPSDAIYPSAVVGKKASTESMKVSFGSFTARNN